MSSRFSTRRSQPVQRFLGGVEQFAPVLVAELDVRRAQAVDRGLGRGKRRAQVVADRGQQGGAQPVDLRELADRGGALFEALLPQRDRGLGGERLDDPAVSGGQGVSAQHQ